MGDPPRPAPLGGTILIRALITALVVSGIMSAIRAIDLMKSGQPVELRTRVGSIGGGQGGSIILEREA